MGELQVATVPVHVGVRSLETELALLLVRRVAEHPDAAGGGPAEEDGVRDRV